MCICWIYEIERALEMVNRSFLRIECDKMRNFLGVFLDSEALVHKSMRFCARPN